MKLVNTRRKIVGFLLIIYIYIYAVEQEGVSLL